MSLNIIDNFDENLRYNNNHNTSYKKLSKLPVISMQTNKNFTLIQNRKGKIIKNPIFSGYTKNKLSSIPRDVEIILLDKEKHELLNKIGKLLNRSNSKDNIFDNKIYINPYSINNKIRNFSSQKSSSYISENINNKSSIPFSTNSSNSMIDNTIKKKENVKDNKKTSNYWEYYRKTNRNNNGLSDYQNNLSFDEYKLQFHPGPSDYYYDKSFDKINLQNKYRYKSLYVSTIHKNKKNELNIPGPGSYLKISNILENNSKLGINLGRKEKRFKNLFKRDNGPLSPWYYSSNNSNNNKDINKNILKEKKINNKDIYDFRYYIIKDAISDTGEKKRFYIEDINHKISDNNINNFKRITKFFDNSKNEKKRSMKNLLKKYIYKNEKKDYEVPGPGKYDIYVGFDKILKDKEINDIRNINKNKQEKFIPENILNKYSLCKKNPSFFENENESNLDENSYRRGMGSKSCENISLKESTNSGRGTLPFISKKKRIEFHDDLLLKHNPGPCYYYNDSSSHSNFKKKRFGNTSKIII